MLSRSDFRVFAGFYLVYLNSFYGTLNMHLLNAVSYTESHVPERVEVTYRKNKRIKTPTRVREIKKNERSELYYILME